MENKKGKIITAGPEENGKGYQIIGARNPQPKKEEKEDKKENK